MESRIYEQVEVKKGRMIFNFKHWLLDDKGYSSLEHSSLHFSQIRKIALKLTIYIFQIIRAIGE